MTIDQEIEEIIKSFDPSTYTLAQKLPALEPSSEQKNLCNILEKRTDNSFYQALSSAISAISDLVQERDVTTDTERERNKKFAKFLLLGIAARERVLSRPDIQKVERDCSASMPFSDVLWRELELFESVCRLTDALGIHRPELLQDERQAWGRAFLREFARSISANPNFPASSPPTDSFQRQSESLKRSQNIAIFQREPEKYLIIDYALRLANWDDHDIKVSHPASRDRSRLRNDIRQKLTNYKTALKSLEVDSNTNPRKLSRIDSRRMFGNDQ